MCGGESPEVNKKAVPGSLLDITVLKGLKGQVGCSPGECSNDVSVVFEDIESGTGLAAGEIRLKDSTGVVVGWFAYKDGSGRFKELCMC